MSIAPHLRWRIKKPKKKYNDFSISLKLRKENKTSEEFEIMLNNLTFEEIIGLKLEMASKAIGGKLYGLQLWHSLPDIARDAILKYVLCAFKSYTEGAAFIGVRPFKFKKYIEKYETLKFFEEEKKDC